MAVHQSAYLQLTHRHRGQAPSHIDSVISQGATWLEQQPQVARVDYPGLKSHPQHDLAKQQMRGFGGMISVDLNWPVPGVFWRTSASAVVGEGLPTVGASLLAKNQQAPRLFRKHALALTFFASELAPTGALGQPRPHFSLR